MVDVKQTPVIDIVITNNARLAIKKDPKTADHEETDIM